MRKLPELVESLQSLLLSHEDLLQEEEVLDSGSGLILRERGSRKPRESGTQKFEGEVRARCRGSKIFEEAA